jgi:uncharacterized membrane protein
MTNIQFQRGAVDAGGAVTTAWEMVKRRYGMYLGVAAMTMVLTGCIPCLNLFLIGPVMGGIAYLVLRDLRGEPVEFGMMFKGFEKFVPLMVIGLIQSIPGIIAQVLQYGIRFASMGLNGMNRRSSDLFVPSDSIAPYLAGGMLFVVIAVAIGVMVFSLVWWACFFFAIPLAMEYDLGPVDAIKLSAQAAINNMGGMILLLLLSILIVLVGVLMLCVGAFLISMPVIYVANVLVYRQVFPWFERNMGNMMPPPPSSYGDFGARPAI